jgi:hypothetical protein
MAVIAALICKIQLKIYYIKYLWQRLVLKINIFQDMILHIPAEVSEKHAAANLEIEEQ